MKARSPARRFLVAGTGTTAALVALILGVVFLKQQIPEATEQTTNPRHRLRIVQLRFAQAPSIERTIRREFSIPEDPEERGPGSPLVVAHEPSNSILLQGSPEKFDTILRRIQQLDTSDSAK